MAKLKLTMACWNYDRTRALLEDRVPIDSVELTYLNLPAEEIFFRMLRYHEFEVAELSLSSYTLSLFRENPPFVAIPVIGKRVGVAAIIAYTLSIMLPVYLQSHDANQAWETGAAAVAWTGIFKLAAAPFAGHIRRFIPSPAAMTVFGAAMYSYLARWCYSVFSITPSSA